MPEVSKSAPLDERMFCGHFPTGISYADRAVEEDNDYKRRGYLFYNGKLVIEKDCPGDIAAWIVKAARKHLRDGKFTLNDNRKGLEYRWSFNPMDNRHPA